MIETQGQAVRRKRRWRRKVENLQFRAEIEKFRSARFHGSVSGE
jgi:hypothetical protein